MTPRSSPEGKELDTVADPGEGPGGRSLFLDQREARRTKKTLFGDPPPPPPLSKGLDDRGPLTYLKVWIRHCRQTQENGGNRTYRKRSERSIGPISRWRVIYCKARAAELEKETHRQHEINRKSQQRVPLSHISAYNLPDYMYVYRAIPKSTMKCAGVVFLRRTPRDNHPALSIIRELNQRRRDGNENVLFCTFLCRHHATTRREMA